MKFIVRVQPLAEQDLDAAYLWIYRHAPETAGRWLVKFHDALASLADHPRRCGLAPEHSKLNRELRQLLIGRRPHVFRAIFVIDRDVVQIIRIRRASRRPLTRRELGDPGA